MTRLFLLPAGLSVIIVVGLLIGAGPKTPETPEEKVADLQRVCAEEYGPHEQAVFDCIVRMAGRWGREQAARKAESVYNRTTGRW